MGEINNSMFDHFLITRFNLKNNDWNVDKNDNVICDKDWLNFRFDIFEKTCFNSIKNQNNFINSKLSLIQYQNYQKIILD